MSITERFWKKVDKSSNCWVWTASKSKRGYGHFKIHSKVWQAHRYSWLIHYGYIPKGLCVCHVCDDPACVNPGHLWIGTQLENMQDKIKKGRLRVGIGERHGHSKLSNKQVLKIRAIYSKGVTRASLAQKYRVTPANIGNVVNRKTWKHI